MTRRRKSSAEGLALSAVRRRSEVTLKQIGAPVGDGCDSANHRRKSKELVTAFCELAIKPEKTKRASAMHPRSLCGRDGHHGAAQGTTCRRQPRSVRHEDHGTAGGAQRRQRPLSEWYEHHGAAQRADGRREDCWWSEAAARKCLRGGRAGIAIFSCPIHVNLIAPLYPGFRAMQKHTDEGFRVALCRRVTGNGRERSCSVV